MIIDSNEIKKNGGSGIDLQFYEISNDEGRVYLFGNNLSENNDYGLNCDMPSGGDASDEYWDNSIYLLSGNTIENNKKNEINKRCSINNTKTADIKTLINKYEGENKKNKLDKAIRKSYREELENNVDMRQIKLSETVLKYKKELDDIGTNMQKINRLIIFLFGISDSTLEKMRDLRDESHPIINEALDLLQQTADTEKINKLNSIYTDMLNSQISQNNSINYYKKLGLLNKFKCLLNFKSSDGKCYEK